MCVSAFEIQTSTANSLVSSIWVSIRKLLPKRMEKFADIGGGYGRLANEYLKRARKVIIFDYSKSELKQAKEMFGDKVETRAGDIYELPFKDDM